MPSLEFAFCFFHKLCVHLHVLGRHLKETIPSSSITWYEMGKQNIQAKEVYWPYFILRYNDSTMSRLTTGELFL